MHGQSWVGCTARCLPPVGHCLQAVSCIAGNFARAGALANPSLLCLAEGAGLVAIKSSDRCSQNQWCLVAKGLERGVRCSKPVTAGAWQAWLPSKAAMVVNTKEAKLGLAPASILK